MLARDVMSRPVLTVFASTTVTDATQLLIDHGFTAAPVTDEDDRLIGIVTEADLLRDRTPVDPGRAGRYSPRHRGERRGRIVADVMTTPVESLTPGADVADAAQIMLDEHLRCLPIVDGYAVVGVITRRDLLRLANARDRVGKSGAAPVAAPPRDFDPDCP